MRCSGQIVFRTRRGASAAATRLAGGRRRAPARAPWASAPVSRYVTSNKMVEGPTAKTNATCNLSPFGRNEIFRGSEALFMVRLLFMVFNVFESVVFDFDFVKKKSF